MKLEYIIIFKEEGVPIYSQCYGSFCANVGFDDALYSGFLSALTTMPSMFGDEGGLQSVEMGFTKLHFDKTVPSGHIICVGIVKSTINDEDIDNQLESFYASVNDLLETEYGDQNWIQTETSDIQRFEDDLLHKAIYPNFPYFIDNEICKDGCPFDHDQIMVNSSTKEPLGIVEHFKKKYDKTLDLVKRLFGWIYLPLYHWFDVRKYRKKREAAIKDQKNSKTENNE